jgi:hypothetical protein
MAVGLALPPPPLSFDKKRQLASQRHFLPPLHTPPTPPSNLGQFSAASLDIEDGL